MIKNFKEYEEKIMELQKVTDRLRLSAYYIDQTNYHGDETFKCFEKDLETFNSLNKEINEFLNNLTWSKEVARIRENKPNFLRP